MKSKREVLFQSKTNNRTNSINSYLKATKIISNPKRSSPCRANSLNKIQSNIKQHILSEDNVEIKIPTPFPQNHFMLIEDESLLNSPYTHILNEKFPPRKYLKHNLTSWNKFHKNKPSKDLQIKFFNPQINFEDSSLKKIKNCVEMVDTEEIKNLDDAIDLISRLKTKIVEYEITNNKNIETSIEHINCLKEESEFFKNKLIENYQKMNGLCEKYNIEESDLNNCDDFVIGPFRKKWLKKIFLDSFKEKISKIKIIRGKYFDFQMRRDNILKFKAILCLEKNYMTDKYKKKFDSRKVLTLIKKSFDTLRFNVFIRKISERFLCIKRTINIMVYMKELKLNSGYSKYFRSLKNKAFYKYFKTQTAKALKILKINSLIGKEKNDDSRKNISSVSNKDKLKAINIWRKAFSKNFEFSKTKLKIDNKNKKFISNLYFSKWRDYSQKISKEISLNLLFKKIYFKILLNNINNNLNCENSLENKKKIFSRRVFDRFFDIIKKKMLLKFQKQKIYSYKVREIHFKSFINGMLKSSNENPALRYVSKIKFKL